MKIKIEDYMPEGDTKLDESEVEKLLGGVLNDYNYLSEEERIFNEIWLIENRIEKNKKDNANLEEIRNKMIKDRYK